MLKLDHLTLRVKDFRAARDFYRSVLGMKVEFEVAERGVAAMQDDAGFTIFLETSAAPPSACVLYFQVDAVDARHRELTTRGVRFIHAPRKEFWGYGAELEDPDGCRVRLWDEESMKASDS